jgi:transposase-like protein
MNDAERIKRYTCALCGKRWVVPDLARLCEEKHLQSEYE